MNGSQVQVGSPARAKSFMQDQIFHSSASKRLLYLCIHFHFFAFEEHDPPLNAEAESKHPCVPQFCGSGFEPDEDGVWLQEILVWI